MLFSEIHEGITEEPQAEVCLPLQISKNMFDTVDYSEIHHSEWKHLQKLDKNVVDHLEILNFKQFP